MIKYAVAYLATAVVFFVLDFIWLSTMSGGFYRRKIGDLLMDQPNFAVAGAFYVFYVVGIVYFAVLPALNAGSWPTALFSGALLGLVAYGTYDMTNLATLKGWSISMSVVDMAWGTVLTAIAASGGYFITSWLIPQSS
ncbi:DUF2177 family protein [Aurantimonas marianensis]|uniref:DUF2177 family protein n=1 Tax=Aurantimonas marianensis TaxID=2920428 RepID=UPI0021119231|nr:DUF2177 family protein [Aurantimonas marianensis]